MEKIVLVHLSDIHFNSSSGTSIHDLDAEVRNELLRDATALTKRLEGTTGVLVTGDIAYSGQKAEYDQAGSWLVEFCRAVGCPDESVWVVPGNHDVDRKVANKKVTKMIHESLRAKQGTALDKELREILSDEQLADALFAPLAEYNAFAARFQCSISAVKPFWERDLMLPCGSVIRLRGLCSALVSNEQDKKSNIVIGSAQVTVHRADGVEYLTLCHHPPEWLLDQDTVVTQLESKVRIQLFGHKHMQRIQKINETLRITAGAMHPERDGSDWEPIYNILEIERHNDEQIGVRIYQRRWHRISSRFVADIDPESGKDYREQIWQSSNSPPRKEHCASRPHEVTRTELAVSVVDELAIPAKDNLAMPQSNHERRLTFRFLTLPFRHQITVAKNLEVLSDTDQVLGDEALFKVLFKRAAEKGLLGKLWTETEKLHDNPADFNPYEDQK